MRFFLFLMLCCCRSASMGQTADITLLRHINVERNRNLDGGMEFISNSEYALGVAMPVSVCVAAWVRRDQKLLEKGVNMSLAMVLNTGSTFLLKRVINRPRPSASYPDIEALEAASAYSFPSGHTSNAFVAATSLSLNLRKWYYVVPSFAWAAAVGYSRMHLGVHYPSDVLGGALLGAGSAVVTYKVNQWLKKRYVNAYVPLFD